MFLSAVGLRLPHPTSGEELTVAIEQPDAFAAYCAEAAGQGFGQGPFSAGASGVPKGRLELGGGGLGVGSSLVEDATTA